MRALKAVVALLPTFVRLLVGIVLVSSGWRWITRPDAATYLAEALNSGLGEGYTVGFYQPFLRDVVLPQVGVFASLVGWGELLSGLSIGFGVALRLGAGVIAFQFLNYGLLGGPMGLLSHGVMTGLVMIPVVFQSARRFGIDKWLYARWPRARIW
ncbi:MAG: DoxX family membrane protein [Gemmatimonadota bacterium]